MSALLAPGELQFLREQEHRNLLPPGRYRLSVHLIAEDGFTPRRERLWFESPWHRGTRSGVGARR